MRLYWLELTTMRKYLSAGHWINKLRIIKKQWLIGKKVMNLAEEIKKTLQMEIRLTSAGDKYLEAVITLQDLDVLNSLLREHLGPATKVSGKEVYFPKKIQELIDSLGGLRIEQSFFYRQDGKQVIYAAIWPWQSDPNRITLKSGISEVAANAG
jgi:hypothetical protein